MTDLTAKTHYHKTHTEAQRTALIQHVTSPEVKEAMVYVMASLADDISAGQDAAAHVLILYGARKFREKLVNLGELVEEVAPLPTKQFKPVPTQDGR